MAYVREKSLEGNTVLNILYHDWKERTGGCLCCWFLGGKSNRNRVITPIFLCPSVAFRNHLVCLLNWCFLCYCGLPGLVIPRHLRKLSSLCCKCRFWLGKQTSETSCSLSTAYAFLFAAFFSAWMWQSGRPFLVMAPREHFSTSSVAHTGRLALLFCPIWNEAKIRTYLPVSWATPTAGVHSVKSLQWRSGWV